METTDVQLVVTTTRQHSHDIPDLPSSASDTAMASEAGGDPMHEQLARGNPDFRLGVVTQEFRDELAEMRHAYHIEVHA